MAWLDGQERQFEAGSNTDSHVQPTAHASRQSHVVPSSAQRACQRINADLDSTQLKAHVSVAGSFSRMRCATRFALPVTLLSHGTTQGKTRSRMHKQAVALHGNGYCIASRWAMSREQDTLSGSVLPRHARWLAY